MKKFLTVLFCLTFLVGILGLTACGFGSAGGASTGEPTDDILASVLTVYAEAQSLGYEGTLDEFLALVKGEQGVPGQDGVGVEKIEINENGELIIYYTNETFVNLGVVVGKNGENGKDGVGVEKIEINDKGELVITYTDGNEVNLGVVVGKDGENGTNGNDGENGKDGQNGQDGKDGVGVEKIEINENGELIIYYTDETFVNLGVVVGKDGENGKDGQNGTDGEDGEDLTACEHSYGDWSTEREATCESIGVNIRTCTNCGVVEYEFIEEKGHLYEPGYTLVNTCGERKVIYYCTVCTNAKFVNEEPVVEHDFEFTKALVDTCKERNLLYTCSVCGATKEVGEEPTVEHNIVKQRLHRLRLQPNNPR